MTQKIYRERSDGVDAVHGEDEVKPGMSKTQPLKLHRMKIKFMNYRTKNTQSRVIRKLSGL